MPREIEVVMDVIGSYVHIFSIIGIFTAIGIVLYLLLKETNKWERLLLGVIFVSSGLVRFIFGSFAPWRQHDHHIDIFTNLKSNLSETGLFSIGNRYHASGGLFEMFYDIPLQIIGEFNIYTVYYTSLAIHLLAGLLVFKLALSLFKKKEVAFISYLIFAFLPILIEISASELIFHINVLTILLFAVYGLHLFEKIKSGTDNWHNYIVLLALFASNLLGRYEYLMIFLGTTIPLFLLLIVTSFDFRKSFFSNRKMQSFAFFSAILTLFAFFKYLFPSITNPGELSYRLANFTNFNSYLYSFCYTCYRMPSYGIFLRSFLTPLYFFLALLITPIFLFKMKRWYIIAVNSFAILLLSFLMTDTLTDFRRVMPLLIFIIPQVAYALYHMLSIGSKINRKKILILASILIILSTYQNKEFLRMETARKIEQELILEFVESVPENSLLLTIDNEFDYRYMQHGNSFDRHLIPSEKDVSIVDIYTEYSSEMLKEYDNIFYYRGLYSYHESNWNELKKEVGDAYDIINKERLGPYEVSKKFERNHSLTPLMEETTPNRLTHTPKVDDYINGNNRTIRTNYRNLRIGFFKINKKS